MKTKPFTFSFTERNKEMLEEIRADRGYATLTATIAQAIIEMHQRTFKDYVMARRVKSEMTPQERARDVEERKAAKEVVKADKIVAKQYAICDDLGGTVVEKNGTFECHYNTYSAMGGRVESYLQEVAFGALSEDMLKSQYNPSRETVEKLQELKTA